MKKGNIGGQGIMSLFQAGIIIVSSRAIYPNKWRINKINSLVKINAKQMRDKVYLTSLYCMLNFTKWRIFTYHLFLTDIMTNKNLEINIDS
jgi:hypothetical protein